ncbi:MAG: NAD-dependent malic enzyme [Thiothrix sp.]|nr:MAG: NAD-dependent malic enzyme [Thiothrix sp.]
MARWSPYFHYMQDENGKPYAAVTLRGQALLSLGKANKGTAFTAEERQILGLDGLLPPFITTIDQQVERIYQNYLRQHDDLAKYLFLRAAQDRNEVVFFALLERHLEEMLPIVYTPTVGKAVQQFSSLYKAPRGLTFTIDNIDKRAEELIENTGQDDVRMIVVTDSSAILGIGDQGHGGMAICIGKLALYTAGGGVSPFDTMPVGLDVGSDRKDLLEDPLYLGARNSRLRGEAYFEFLDKFVDAIQSRWPHAIIQWEDFAKDAAFAVLERYRDRVPSFNDDIQGTGAVALAGLLSACQQKNECLRDQRVVIVGAGAGGVGVASAILEGMKREGLSDEQARQQLFVMDGRGLVTRDRIAEAEYKYRIAQPPKVSEKWQKSGPIANLMEVVENAQPTVLIGLSGVAGLFSQPIIECMNQSCEQPIVFPLSNPTSSCEAIPQDLMDWTNGKAIIATGSPFPDVTIDGQSFPVGQGNNAFIFPGLGFAAILARCQRISDAMVLESAYALAEFTTDHYADQGLIYPPVSILQEVSIQVAARVLRKALEDGSSPRSDLQGKDLVEYVRTRFWKPEYLPYRYVQNLP